MKITIVKFVLAVLMMLSLDGCITSGVEDDSNVRLVKSVFTDIRSV
jgi:hypothetical protein